MEYTTWQYKLQEWNWVTINICNDDRQCYIRWKKGGQPLEKCYNVYYVNKTQKFCIKGYVTLKLVCSGRVSKIVL